MYPRQNFGHGGRAQALYSALNWVWGPCVHMFYVGSLALNPQFRNSEHVLGLLNVKICSDRVPCV